jgi:hypothetical protein
MIADDLCYPMESRPDNRYEAQKSENPEKDRNFDTGFLFSNFSLTMVNTLGFLGTSMLRWNVFPYLGFNEFVVLGFVDKSLNEDEERIRRLRELVNPFNVIRSLLGGGHELMRIIISFLDEDGIDSLGPVNLWLAGTVDALLEERDTEDRNCSYQVE